MTQKRNKYFSPIQVEAHVKKQIVELCNKRGYKISSFIELMFLEVVSGSASYVTGSLGNTKQ